MILQNLIQHKRKIVGRNIVLLVTTVQFQLPFLSTQQMTRYKSFLAK